MTVFPTGLEGLPTRAKNALCQILFPGRNFYDGLVVTKHMVRALPRRELLRYPNLGKVSVEAIEVWLGKDDPRRDDFKCPYCGKGITLDNKKRASGDSVHLRLKPKKPLGLAKAK